MTNWPLKGVHFLFHLAFFFYLFYFLGNVARFWCGNEQPPLPVKMKCPALDLYT